MGCGTASSGMVGCAWKTCFRRKILEVEIEEQDRLYQIKQSWGQRDHGAGGEGVRPHGTRRWQGCWAGTCPRMCPGDGSGDGERANQRHSDFPAQATRRKVMTLLSQGALEEGQAGARKIMSPTPDRTLLKNEGKNQTHSLQGRPSEKEATCLATLMFSLMPARLVVIMQL